MLDELICDFKSCWHLRIIKCCIVVTIALCAYMLLSFVASTNGAIKQSFSRQADYDIYSLVDSFMDDPEGFYAFRQDREKLSSLARFDEGLSSSGCFTFLSVFDQPVTVFDFKGGEEFGYSYGMGYGSDVIDYGGRSAFNAKAVQLNRAAFDFYGLRVAKGASLPWGDADWNEPNLPVLLGSAYVGAYDLGDILEGDLYGQSMRFEVMGFLEEGSSILYQGNPAFGLDYSIVIPYPSSFEELANLEGSFGGIALFAYVNGELAVAKGTQASVLLDALDRISADSGFDGYGVAGLYDYSTKVTQIRQLIEDNVATVGLMGALLLGVGCVVLAAANSALASGHSGRRRLAEILGVADVWQREATGMTLLWWCATIALTMLLTGWLPYQNLAFRFMILGALLLAALIDTGFCLIQERRVGQ